MRAAAVRVVDLAVRRQRHLLWWAIPVYVVLIAGDVRLALTENPVWWAAGAAFAILLVWTVFVRRRTQERQRVLAT